jgi:hypothetical protein
MLYAAAGLCCFYLCNLTLIVNLDSSSSSSIHKGSRTTCTPCVHKRMCCTAAEVRSNKHGKHAAWHRVVLHLELRCMPSAVYHNCTDMFTE